MHCILYFQDVQFYTVTVIYLSKEQFNGFRVKDTDSGGGCDGQDGTNRNGLLSILQVPRTVGTSHDTYTTHKHTQTILNIDLRLVMMITAFVAQVFAYNVGPDIPTRTVKPETTCIVKTANDPREKTT